MTAAASDPRVRPLADDFPPPSDADWRALAEASLAGRSLDALTSRTDDGLPVPVLVTAAEAADAVARAAGAVAPIPVGPWDIRQAHGHPDPVACNARMREDLEGGVTSLIVGVDPDGEHGAIVRGTDDLARLLDGVLVDLAPVYLAPAGPWEPLAEAYRAWLATRDVDIATLRGGLGADPLGLLATTGRLETSVAEALRRLGALAARTHATLPAVRAVSVSSVPAHNAWASEAVELAALLATGVAYLRALVAAGLDVPTAASQLTFTVAADADQFLSMAKVRAARRLWARVLEACGVPAADAPMALTAVTSPRMLTRHDPYVNVLRATVAAFSAGVGGADALCVLPHDAALGMPGARARRLARNLHHVLLGEGHVRRVTDPAGGAWLHEQLTDGLAREAWRVFREIESEGGMAEALTSGTLAARIAPAAAARWRRIATRRDALTGVSAFPLDTEPTLDTTTVDLAALRATRGASTLAAAPPPAGDVPASMVPLPAMRLAEPYEVLRDAADAYRAATGVAPTVFLATIGARAAWSARAGFAAQLFGAGGFVTTTGPGGTDAAAIASAFVASGASIACLCGSDDGYAEHATAVASALVGARARGVWLAGKPGEHEGAWRASGVCGFVHRGVDAPAALRTAQLAAGLAPAHLSPPFATRAGTDPTAGAAA